MKRILANWTYNSDHLLSKLCMEQIIWMIFPSLHITWQSRFRSHIKRPSSATRHRAIKKQAKAQRRLTVTLGLITISTIIFYIVPFSVVAAIFYMSISAPAFLTIGLAMLCRISSVANILIYMYRQTEVRPGMWKILSCNCWKSDNVSSIFVSASGATLSRNSQHRRVFIISNASHW